MKIHKLYYYMVILYLLIRPIQVNAAAEQSSRPTVEHSNFGGYYSLFHNLLSPPVSH